MEKVIILDGINTIIKNENFITDSVPRFLAKCLDEKYKFWMRVDDMDITGILDYECVPFWLKQSVVVIKDNVLENVINTMKFTKDSFIISNESNTSNMEILRKFKFKIFKSCDIFNCNKYKKIDIADIVLCFGFEFDEFKKMCSETGLLEYQDRINSKNKKYNGVAFLVKSDNLELEYKDIYEKFRKLVAEKKYQINHKEYVIGITKNGLGLEDLNLNIINGNKLPLILV